ncbi:hypothetical protein FB451DRAFT_1343295 [Mycena latifolia]|nr:hypothetical protein FB451DRAFT_1343295 [Mycena latifolia]
MNTGRRTRDFNLVDLSSVPENAPVANFVDRMSQDRHCLYREEWELQPPSPLKCQRLAATAASQQANTLPALFEQDGAQSLTDERYQLNVDDDDEPPLFAIPEAPKAPRKVKPGDPALDKWQLTRLDGPGDVNVETCPGCRGKCPPLFRCSDCFGGTLYCEDCIVARHLGNPLHWIWRWCRNSFVKTLLAALGLRVQLGHAPGDCCPGAEAANVGFVTLHTNGIHEVRVDFCGCERQRTLLRYGWFPATNERPQTCATLDVLSTFQQETLQSKMTMYDFYGVLEKLTNNTGIKPPDRYHEWLRMCREFNHAIMLKCRGRATSYASGGAEATKQGELVLECPACPHPGVNLPEGWEKATPDKRFLYTLFIALDTCFRLKRLLVSSELRDPDLGSGWGYMVDTGPYRKYLRTVTDQKEMNTCSGLAALNYANTIFSRGYSTTRVGMGVCARHKFVQPNGVGDLQRGEQFANMDYVFASILSHKHKHLFKLVSYDIVCIWSKHLLERLKALPPNVRIVIVATLICFTIPKMHIHTHTLLCQLLFSLNYLIGSAETDGEGIEQVWGPLGAVAASSRDMGPGSHHNLLECQLHYWNWLKLISIVVLTGTIVDSLHRRLDRAEAELKEQTEFRSGRRWLLGRTEAQIRLDFAEEEAAEAARGVPSVHDVSPSTFVAAGLDLEGEQRRGRMHAELKKKGTTAMKISMKCLHGKLNRSIVRFRKLQKVYMPAAFQALAKKDLAATTLVEDVPLMLPSALTAVEWVCYVPGLDHIERLLWDGQCRTSLVALQNKLHVKSRLLTYKTNQTRHQGPNTRARAVVTHNETKIHLSSEKYQCAWEAIRLLSGGSEASVGWRRLRKDDIRYMQDQEDMKRKAKRHTVGAVRWRRRDQELFDHGLLPAEKDNEMDWEDVEDEEERGPENQRQVSWIWSTAGTSRTDADLEDADNGHATALRVEWCKAFARVRRWMEEKRLVTEEYRRVPLSFKYEAAKWDARAASVRIGVLPLAEVEGGVAYAARQVAMYRDLIVRGERRGKKKARHLPSAVVAMQAEQAWEREREREDALAEGWEDCESDGEDDSDNDLGFGRLHLDNEAFIMGSDGFDG